MTLLEAHSSPADAPADERFDGRLIDPALLQIDYLPPPLEVAPYVTTFFLMRCDERTIRDVQPAMGGTLGIFMRGGEGHIRFLDGRVEPSHRFVLLTPASAAAAIAFEGPWHAFGAALSPLGWAALTGLSAAEHANHLYDAEAVLGPDFADAAERICAGYRSGTLVPSDMVAVLSAAIMAHVRPLPEKHLALLQSVARWLGASLSPALSGLDALTGYSARQTQRLVDHYYGLPPKGLARKYRAIRAASLLADPRLSADDADAIADHFYDQSHMIREIRMFVGRTPARVGDPGQPYLSAIIDLRNFREVSPRIAPLPDDLRA